MPLILNFLPQDKNLYLSQLKEIADEKLTLS